MKSAFAFLLLALFATSACGAEAKRKHRYILYATFLEGTPVTLADGAEWLMDKGDSFPVLMFKEQQTKVVLQLAGTNFWTATDRVRIVQEKEITPEMLASYRRNVEAYLEGRSKRWKAEAERK